MIDIDEFEKCALQFQGRFWMTLRVDNVLAFIAEIRRLRGERKEHRKCVLGCGENGKGYMRVSHRSEGECDLRPLYWVSCGYCGHNGPIRMTEDEAWAAWDGVE